jgi:hypothetical protein
MINLSCYLTPSELAPLKQLYLTELAATEIKQIVASCGAIHTPEAIYKVVAVSAACSVLTDYHNKSAWFRAQPIHTFVSMVIGAEGQPQTRPVMLLQRTPGAAIIATTTEVTLPESYMTERLIEETKIDWFEFSS